MSEEKRWPSNNWREELSQTVSKFIITPKMKPEDYQQYADDEGVSVEAYMYLFKKHDHDQREKLFDGAATVTMSDALTAIRIDRRFRTGGNETT